LDREVSAEDYSLLEHRIRKVIPMGLGRICDKVEYSEKEFYYFLTTEYLKVQSSHPGIVNHIKEIDGPWISDFCKRIRMGEGDFYKSIGSLGGGNHFIEYGEDSEGLGWFSIHTGSRNLGQKVCDYWLSIGSRSIVKEKIKEANKRIKEEEPDRRKWRDLIKESTQRIKNENPEGYLSGDAMIGYFSDMVLAQVYSRFNHLQISRKIYEVTQSLYPEVNIMRTIASAHNYIDFGDMIIRKGATRAHSGEYVLIPFNMRDGLGIFKGKGNRDYNFSAPHGSGRIMSRSKAFQEISLGEFEESMKGVYSTSVVSSVIDESPMAYKDTREILNLISDTVDLVEIIKPKINIKATN
jgi:RNA-splicing ligase RtcB